MGESIFIRMKAGIEEQLLAADLESLITDNSLKQIAEMFGTNANNVFKALKVKMNSDSYLRSAGENPTEITRGAWTELKESELYQEVLLGSKTIGDVK